MKKIFIFLSLSLITLFACQINNKKIKKCLKEKNCTFIVFGALTPKPEMSFVVLKNVWKKFNLKDKQDLKKILECKIREARKNPTQFNTLNPYAPLYNLANKNIQNINSYSVILSHGKSDRGALYLDKELKKW